MSGLTQDELTAIYCYANGWDADGKPYFSCSSCSESRKEQFGCGLDPALSGSCKIANSAGHDLRGICPGWWRQQPFIMDLIQMTRFRTSLGHPLHIPNRLIVALSYLDIYEVEAAQKLRELKK